MNIRVAAVQMNSGADLAANLRAAEALLAEAAAQGARLAVLPENFAFMGAREQDKLVHAETSGHGPIQHCLMKAAQRHQLEIIGGTLPMKVDGLPKVFAASLFYNTAGVALAEYHKIHLFDVDVMRAGKAESYRESNSIQAGPPQALSVNTCAGKTGLSVCYDLRFGELYRALAAQGAQILSVTSAFTYKTGEAHWEVLLRARAIETQCYVIAPNQCGTHPGGRQTWGHSMIVDPWGGVLAQQASEPGVVLAEIDLQQLEDIRRNMPCQQHRKLP